MLQSFNLFFEKNKTHSFMHQISIVHEIHTVPFYVFGMHIIIKAKICAFVSLQSKKGMYMIL